MDEIFINFLREKELYHEIWQAFAVFMDVRSVGVQVRPRTHARTPYISVCQTMCAGEDLTSPLVFFQICA